MARLVAAAFVACSLLFAPSALAAPPVNDDATGAEELDGRFPILSTPVDITDATEGDDPEASCRADTSRGVWYRYTPEATDTYGLTTASGDGPTATTVPDTVLSVYTSEGGAAGPFTELPTGGELDGCDDDDAVDQGFQSTLVTRLEGGTEYWILVEQFGTDSTGCGRGDGAAAHRLLRPGNDAEGGAQAPIVPGTIIRHDLRGRRRLSDARRLPRGDRLLGVGPGRRVPLRRTFGRGLHGHLEALPGGWRCRAVPHRDAPGGGPAPDRGLALYRREPDVQWRGVGHHGATG